MYSLEGELDMFFSLKRSHRDYVCLIDLSFPRKPFMALTGLSSFPITFVAVTQSPMSRSEVQTSVKSRFARLRGLRFVFALVLPPRPPTVMFNMYQRINRGGEEKEVKEPDVIGHDRFYQERSRSYRRKKRAPRRTQSAAEFSTTTLTAAKKRNIFRTRSQSSENRDSKDGAPSKSDSLAKMFIPKGLRYDAPH